MRRFITGKDNIDSASFRDRNARVFYGNTSVYRGLGAEALKEWEALTGTSFFDQFMKEGSIIGTHRVDPWVPRMDGTVADEWVAVLKHERIPFLSYPYEWTFGMLKEAAMLQLDLIKSALDEGMILKDSSAFNVQWTGASPVFIDIASFEVLRKGEPWIGYRQFCQMFLYPLMLQSYKGVPFQPWMRGCIDGIAPENFSKLMSRRDLMRPGVFLHVYLQAKAQAKYAATKSDIKKGLSSAGFDKEIIRRNVMGLRKLVDKLSWNISRSEWSHYSNEHSYTDADFEVKKSFVRDIAKSKRWRLVWDLGCNTGTFSRIASENADYVVAMDADQLAVEYLYQELKKEGNKSILPLVGNIADPSPNLGWRGLERRSLPERRKPELTLCLALIHHIVISANIPVDEFIDWLGGLGTSLVIEFVTKEDPMVKKLLLNKIDNYDDYEVDYFEKSLADVFNVKKREALKSGTRILYFAEAKKRQ
ncbi:MAG: class I SAM-dependent methyltransferase [Acidobacteriota bacterium]